MVLSKYKRKEKKKKNKYYMRLNIYKSCASPIPSSSCAMFRVVRIKDWGTEMGCVLVGRAEGIIHKKSQKKKKDEGWSVEQ